MQMCARDERCLQQNPVHGLASDAPIWCALEHHHASDHDAKPHTLVRHFPLQDVIRARELTELGHDGNPGQVCPLIPQGGHADGQMEPLTAECCSEVERRWSDFVRAGGASVEAHHYHEGMSVVFHVFETIGCAASVELYFTIFGVLLKVVFLTHHKKSEEVAALDSHSAHVDKVTGEQVVTVRQTLRNEFLRGEQSYRSSSSSWPPKPGRTDYPRSVDDVDPAEFR